jgi:hypothetical protein
MPSPWVATPRNPQSLNINFGSMVAVFCVKMGRIVIAPVHLNNNSVKLLIRGLM